MSDAITSIYLKLGQYLKNFISKKINNADDVEDIFQDIFIKIHQNLHTLKDENKIVSWIFQVSRNTIVDYMRKKKSMDRISDNFPVEMNYPEDNTSEIVEEGLKILINFLPAEYRDPLLSFEYEEFTIKDIAKKYNLSIPAAKSRIQRARARLKNLVYDFCHFEFDKYGTIINAYPKNCHRCKKK
jgi:RNA polymerase sigma-70 factor, ECF subfamily